MSQADKVNKVEDSTKQNEGCDHSVPGRKWGQPCPRCGVQPTDEVWKGDAPNRPKNS